MPNMDVVGARNKMKVMIGSLREDLQQDMMGDDQFSS